MNDYIKVMEQALEVLELYGKHTLCNALRTAIEQAKVEPITDAVMNLVDRLGSEAREVDPRAWPHLAVYVPPQPAIPDGLVLVSLHDRMPNTDEHHRVIIFTDGHDFNGEQFFDVLAEDLNECRFENPDDQPEVCRFATHWMPLPEPPKEQK